MVKKIISLITLFVIVMTAALMIAPTASAAQVDGAAYRYKLVKNVSLNPSEYMGADTASVYFEGYIELSNGMAGNGSIGYNKDIGSFYVQIDKFVTSDASWCLKYDSSGQWWYRYQPSDYVTEWNNYQMYNAYEGDIYITLNGGKEDIPGFLLTSGVIEDTIETFYFKVDDGESYKVIQTFTEYITLPDAPEIDGQRFVGWSDGVIGGYAAGDTYNTSAFNSTTLIAVYEPIVYNYLFYDNDKLVETIQTSDSVIIMPAAPEEKEGYTFLGWTDGNSLYKAGNEYSVGSFESKTFRASWDPDVVYINFNIDDVFYKQISVVYPNTSVTMLEAPSKEGYRFVGWSDGVIGDYQPGQIVSVDGLNYSNPGIAINMSAVFEPISCDDHKYTYHEYYDPAKNNFFKTSYCASCGEEITVKLFNNLDNSFPELFVMGDDDMLKKTLEKYSGVDDDVVFFIGKMATSQSYSDRLNDMVMKIYYSAEKDTICISNFETNELYFVYVISYNIGLFDIVKEPTDRSCGWIEFNVVSASYVNNIEEIVSANSSDYDTSLDNPSGGDSDTDQDVDPENPVDPDNSTTDTDIKDNSNSSEESESYDIKKLFGFLTALCAILLIYSALSSNRRRRR